MSDLILKEGLRDRIDFACRAGMLTETKVYVSARTSAVPYLLPRQP
jgi:hypothetical protein